VGWPRGEASGGWRTGHTCAVPMRRSLAKEEERGRERKREEERERSRKRGEERRGESAGEK